MDAPPPTSGLVRIVSKIIKKFDRYTEPPSLHREFGRGQPGTPVDAGRKEINVFRQLGENMVALKREMGLKEINGEIGFDRGNFFNLYKRLEQKNIFLIRY